MISIGDSPVTFAGSRATNQEETRVGGEELEVRAI